MNLSTHIMFGILVGVLLFGRPEIALMVGVGSAINDLDREYGFFSKEAFRRRQIHRALFHNFLFIGVVYLINPFFGIGAFLHSFLDSFTTTRDRGVEWLYPFSRIVTKAVYDSDGTKLPLDPKHKIYFLSNDFPGLTRRTTKDIKPGETPMPNRRTYGPALSGKYLDRCIFFGSIAIVLLMILFSVLGVRQFINFSAPKWKPFVYYSPVNWFSRYFREFYCSASLIERNWLKPNQIDPTSFRLLCPWESLFSQ